MRSLVRHGWLCAGLALTIGASVASTKEAGTSSAPVEHFTASAVNNSLVGRPGITPIDITIDRWSSEAERDKLMAIFQEKGSKGLLNALQDTKPVGALGTAGSVGYELRYARELPGEDGGRRIILATDRPVGFWEASNQPRSTDYPFLLIEMHINKNGTGEGKLSVATKLSLNDHTLTIENYANQPVALNDVRSQK